jgi:hypothetical protein
MIKHQTNGQEVNKQLSKINIDYVQIKKKQTTICYRAKAMIHSDQINIINITSNTEWNRTT